MKVLRLMGAGVGLLALGGLVRLRWITGKGWGVEGIDRHKSLPGDDVIIRPHQTLTHATTIGARPEAVWPWIVQMGVDRAGWYTPQWVDRYLWRVGNVSKDEIDPGLQSLEVGQRILDGPEGTAEFEVRDVQVNRALVLHSRRHPVTGVPPDLSSSDPGPYFDFSWTFVLEETPRGNTLLLIRTRGIAQAPWLFQRLAWLLWPMFDYAMARWMLLGIKARVEAVTREGSVSS